MKEIVKPSFTHVEKCQQSISCPHARQSRIRKESFGTATIKKPTFCIMLQYSGGSYLWQETNGGGNNDDFRLTCVRLLFPALSLSTALIDQGYKNLELLRRSTKHA
jgi:hypothetical protein